MTHPVISDIMETITSRVSAEMGYTVHFQQGHMMEVVDIVRQMSADQNISHRYPIIALKHDVKQRYIKYEGVEFFVTMYIITLSRPEYTTKQRIENIFKPYLHPIKKEFVSQMAHSGYFKQQTVEDIEEKIPWHDRLFWGNALVMGNDGNVFDDWVDAIELEIDGLIALEGCYSQVPTKPVLLSMVSDTTGRFIFGKFNKSMADPEGLDVSSLTVTIGSAEVIITVVFLGGSDCMYIFDLGDELITHGATVTITIPDAVFQSADGVDFAGCTAYEVMNNV